uniref:Uncharacterized protein n=1 Tax=Anguilla anguilla TaxID=7936 RepID=A0A0E9Y1N5_ANGAN
MKQQDSINTLRLLNGTLNPMKFISRIYFNYFPTTH